MVFQGRPMPALSIFGAFGVVSLGQIFLADTTVSFARTFRWELYVRPTHYVQAMLHVSIYAYLGMYWDGVGRNAPLIVAQVIFGYLCDMLIAWSSGRI